MVTDKQRMAVKEILAERSYWYLRWRQSDRTVRSLIEAAKHAGQWNKSWQNRAEAAQLGQIEVLAAAIELLKEVDEVMNRTDTDMNGGCRDRITSAMAALRGLLPKDGEEGK